MNINREAVCNAFKEYTDNYNSAETKIKLKIDHTYRVASICDKISENIGLSQEDKDIAWLVGMLHDIGRFEQVRRYNTFSDAVSIDHAQFGADLLFKENLKNLFFNESHSDDKDYEETLNIIETAIRNHSAYRIEDGLNDRYKMFCNIIRDADKIDILRVNATLPVEEIYNVTTEELKNSKVTPEVINAFYEHHAVLRSLKKAPVDNIVGHISLTYELVYDVSYVILHQQGYIYKLMDFKSENSETIENFEKIKTHMSEYISSVISKMQ